MEVGSVPQDGNGVQISWRLGRLHTNMLRELSVIGVELQLTKDKVIVGDNLSTQRLASLEAQLTALSADVEDLRLTITYPQPLSTTGTSSTSLEKSSYPNSIEAILLESKVSSATSTDADS